MSLTPEDAEELRSLIEQADESGLTNSDIELAREALQVYDMENEIAKTMSKFGAKGLETVEEDGTVTLSLNWDDEGFICRRGCNCTPEECRRRHEEDA